MRASSTPRSAILAKARDIYLLGLGGSFPVATHLAYVLRKLGRRVVLLDGIGGSIHEQSHPASSEDALVAISFRNYYPDTARLFPELVARGVPAISITDSLLSPIVEGATVVFEIQDMPEPECLMPPNGTSGSARPCVDRLMPASTCAPIAFAVLADR